MGRQICLKNFGGKNLSTFGIPRRRLKDTIRGLGCEVRKLVELAVKIVPNSTSVFSVLSLRVLLPVSV